ncbi:MAG TPA: ATP-binding protein [Bacteroidales bacterium]|nr:ATP-binding protein [Bacteroidales bacterium]
MYKKLQIESRQNSLRLVEKVIDEVTGELGISKDSYGKILVSTMEGVNNAIMHGNKSVPEKIVDIEFHCKGNDLKVKISDEGEGFRPQDVPDPTLPENIQELNGRGVFLMSRLADEIKYSRKGNAVTMTFKNILD